MTDKRIDPTKFTVTETGQVIKPHKPSMTDKAKAEIEFEEINKKYFDFESIYYDKIKKGVMQAYRDGLVEGRKEKEKEDIDFCNAFCLKADKRALLEQIERMKCCGNCSNYRNEWGEQVYEGKCENCTNLSNWEMKE